MVLTINGGSSSIKFSVYRIQNPLELFLSGSIENIGTDKSRLTFTNRDQQKNSTEIEAIDHGQAADYLSHWLERHQDIASIQAIGHRIVFVMEHVQPEIITDDFLKELKSMTAFDPDHLPEEIKLIEVFKKSYPTIKQIACFDTAFHTSMPMVAQLLSLPRRYFERGIRRYGFHGLSYTYLMEEFERIAGKGTAEGKIILAHLGSGASLAAIKNGKGIDTTMGFTPTSGLPMGTRTGDLDPGVIRYLMQEENIDPNAFNRLINHESGLLGLSETSADMRELLQIESNDHRASEAIDLFCYQTKKWIGAFTAALDGLDTLVFSGGIGENCYQVRDRICEGLKFLGIEIDEMKNRNNETIISTDHSSVKVYVITTNEEIIIARLVISLLKLN